MKELNLLKFLNKVATFPFCDNTSSPLSCLRKRKKVIESIKENNLDSFLSSNEGLNLQNIITEGKNLLQLSIIYESYEISRWLIKTIGQQDSSFLNYQDDRGYSSLHLSICSNNIIIAKELLNTNKIDINLVTNEGYTAISLAAQHNLQDIGRELLKSSAIAKIPDIFGNNPLHFTVRAKNIEFTKILLDYDNQIANSFNKEGYFPLDLALESNSNDKIVKLFFNYPLDLRIIKKIFLETEDEDILDYFFSEKNFLFQWVSSNKDILEELFFHYFPDFSVDNLNEIQDFELIDFELIEDKDMFSILNCESLKEDDWEVIDTSVPHPIEEVKSNEIKIYEIPPRSFSPFESDLKRDDIGEKKETCSQIMNFSELDNCEKKCFLMLEKLSDLENSLKELYQDRLMKSNSQGATFCISNSEKEILSFLSFSLLFLMILLFVYISFRLRQ